MKSKNELMRGGVAALGALCIVLALLFRAIPAFAASPGAPVIGATSAGNAQAAVSFRAPASNGGSAITGYTVSSNPAGGNDLDAGSTGLLHNVTGLTNGTVYTFTVTATNADGTSVPSAASNFTTPRLYAPTTGTINNVVVFIRFSDQPEFSHPLSYYDGLFNSAGNSLKSFYLESSYNTLTVNSAFFPSAPGAAVLSYLDPHPTAYYQPYNASSNTLGYQGAQSSARESALVSSALNAISADLIASGLDLDLDNDGYIDHITFEVYSSDANPLPGIFFSRATYDTSGAVAVNGKKLGSYTWVTATQDASYAANSVASVEIHEMGHSFGYPDLRANNSAFNPVGNWDVMSISSSPVHSGAYEKYRFTHWISNIPEISAYQTYTLNDITQPANNSYKIKIPNKDEFLVLEYRKGAGAFESRLPGSGLCITRVNEAAGIWGNLGGPPYFLYYFRPGGNFTNDGPDANLFKCLSAETGQTQFNDFSNPPCFLSDGTPCGISIVNIGPASGSSITFALGDPASTVVTHALSGFLAYGNGSRVIGASVTLSGDAVGETTTDSLGRYLFLVNAGGNYTVTPTKANVTMAPASKSFTNVVNDQVQNFDAAKITAIVSGTITSSGTPLGGIPVIIGNCPNGGNYVGSTTTDQNGNYSFILDQGSTCDAWASKINYNFSPNKKTFANISQDQVQDFVTAPTLVTLSGKVTRNGSALAGVSVSCPGAASTNPTTTDGAGNYSFSVLVGNGVGYTVTPTAAPYAFLPALRSYNGTVSSQSNQDFAVQPGAATTLVSSVNPSIPGGAVSFNATVTGSGATPSGAVTFNDDVGALCAGVALSGGQAQCTTSALASGSHAISAVYSGDSVNSGSTSTILTQVVVAVPGAPSGAGAAAGNGQAVVSFAAPASDGGSAITGYTVVSNPAGGVDSHAGTTGLSHLITGLTNGTLYSFTVTATNAAGTGSASSATAAVTPATTPGAPVIGSAVAGNAQVVVSFTSPASDGGSGITGYDVVSIPAGGVDSNAGSPGLSHLVTGLANGTLYSFTVRAKNLVGTGPASAASASVIPVASQSIVFAPAASASYGDAPLVLAASASSALPVTFSVVSGPATLNGSTLTITGAGTVIVKASQAGNAGYNAAPEIQRTLQVAKASALVVLGGLNQTYNGSQHSVTVTTTPPGLAYSVSYDGFAAVPVSVGSYSATVTVLDPNYQGAASATLVISAPVVPAGQMTGDINGDEKVDVADALRILRIAVGLISPTADDYLRADVAPLLDGKPHPDGVLDISDALVVLEKAVKLISW
jgi:M6 family metalloprotease-like protein